jgi:hypothetical protein
MIVVSGESLLRGKALSTVSTVDLLELTSLDELLFILKILLTFVTKTSCLNEEANCTRPSPFVSVPLERV